MVSALTYTLGSNPRVNWTAAQDKSLAQDYPFEIERESDEQYVVRTYLQFLWLPESIMPLKLLIPSLSRVTAEPSEPHPLHTLLMPLLQTARSASNKYHVELPQILALGGGAGEMEETMMWYALNHELADDDIWTRTTTIGEGPWEDEKWRMKWIERMERREFQIQILLYFLKLSLPGPPPPQEQSPKKRKRSRKEKEVPIPIIPIENRLEALMDKMSMWQLVASLVSPVKTRSKEGLDWMQIFFEEIVKPQYELFETKLPETCSLLRSKIFPNSPFSSSSGAPSPSSSRATSPDIPQNHKESTKRSSSTRHPSPALSTTSSKTRPLVRKRSRSLSVSLAQERMERERGVGAVASKKRVLNREISMSRQFKPKPKPKDSENNKVERKKTVAQEVENAAKKLKSEGITLVAATPTKPKLVRSQSSFGGGGSQTGSLSFRSLGGVAEEEEEEWRLSSSPDILLLGGSAAGDASSDEEIGGVRVLVSDTPTKRSRLR
ncbi:hypothetical protein Hypma_002791 [Hypsizygus marmoreus]|uniref:DNA replication regulator Sld3 C-terminal domain-containing protein n=1 Tax=Hypsizygus marmoreus TaxID=39966 RepID=A0A369J619_HYPMA|nr:hypothetical protein Hypma_002791 [Hypsizygus marmoreus]